MRKLLALAWACAVAWEVWADVRLEVYNLSGDRAATCILTDGAWADVQRAFEGAIEVRHRVQQRLDAYNQYAAAMGFEEVPMSSAPIKTQIKIGEEVFYFEEDGSLWCDPRFILPEELAVKDLVERYYKAICMQEKVLAALGVEKTPEPEQVKEEPESAAPSQAAPAQVAQAAPKPKRKLPVFRGFEDARYQQYDELILKYTDDFNNNRAAWADSTPGQAASIHDLKPALVKSHMIEESGGAGPKSKKAWQVDPLQVNVPGDWDNIKKQVGLQKPSRRNEGTAAQNVKAAIKYLVRKGFGTSGAPAKTRPGKRFDGWYTALRRYNGRNSRTESGKRYKDAYAERIMKRAESPHAFVPIANDVKKSRTTRSRKASK